MVMNSRLPCRSITVSWMTWRVAKPAEVIWMRSSFWPFALCPSLESVAVRIGWSAARLARLIELIMPDPSAMFIDA